jgi:AraC-like DNA-binding protein
MTRRKCHLLFATLRLKFLSNLYAPSSVLMPIDAYRLFWFPTPSAQAKDLPGTMNFHHHVPSAPLSHFISMMWFGDDYIVPHSLERVLPTGEMSLIINLWENRTRVYNADDPSKFTTCDGSIVVGAYSAFAVIDTDEQRSTAGVVFRPGGAFPFFGLPAVELQDNGTSLANLWGRQATSDLREQLLAARSPEAKFNILERTFLSRINAPLELTHPAVSFAVETFCHRPQRLVSSVTEQVGLSDRHFIQLFSQRVGLTPKLFCRVQRFQQVLRNITARTSNSIIDWPQIALTCGYFDQAHFIHDFRAFSGINPTTYVANKTQFQNHVAL